ncbi:disulfide isomerase [Neolentinus lepideus HHB14362 ss-1]|uniref:Disulfide isomerase n=1 Tax=Neolentinus lepideus HHB14362 ss-1 TaxID=1314782 RepID=A0A165PVL6_9AGAM|nr:disulfide isomerase [Neolentinus lepideus HHB14362 ss-1]
MFVLQLIALGLASVVSAALFPKGTLVKSIDEKGFRKIMQQNQTSVVAFVAPWCGYCQRMAPEYSQAAVGLHPLVSLYAVDCDADKNKGLCAEQGVKGFPTVKLFPRGDQLPSVTYDSNERTANAFFYWASQKVPHTVRKLGQVEDVEEWVAKKPSKPHAVLLSKDKKIPLLWRVLSNKYRDELLFAIHTDKKGNSAATLGVKGGDDSKSKVIVYPAESTKPALYDGMLKMDPLSEFFSAVIDGTADLQVADAETPISDEQVVLNVADKEVLVDEAVKDAGPPPEESSREKDEL